MRLAAGRITAICSITWKWECFVKSGWRNDANEEKFEGHTCSGRRLFTSQLSIAAGSVSADPHAGHDMSAMQMPADENFTEMTSMEPIVTESRTPIPPVTDADRKAAFGNLQGHAIHDSAINYLVLLDQLEWQRSDNTNNFSWSVNSWIGGDTDRICQRVKVNEAMGKRRRAEAQLLWGQVLQWC